MNDSLIAFEKKILADRNNSLIFGLKGGRRIYLVGGSIRDAVIGRKNQDWDYVAEGPLPAFIEEIASALRGKLVQIGKRGLLRIITDHETVDFSLLFGDIEDDLSRRDFTINSIAWSPADGIIDPNGGKEDAVEKIIRMVHEKTIEKDPVRIIRGYRFAAELGFTIEPQTRTAFRRFQSLLSRSIKERITLEFFKILNLSDPISVLKMMMYDGILDQIISCPAGQLQDRLNVLSMLKERFDALLLNINFKPVWTPSQELAYQGLLRLESLLLQECPHRFLLSGKIISRLRKVRQACVMLDGKQVEKDELFEIFEKAEEGAADKFLLEGRLQDLEAYRRYRGIQNKSILSAEEVSNISGLPPGKPLGRVLKLLKKGEFTGMISSRMDAMNFIDSLHLES